MRAFERMREALGRAFSLEEEPLEAEDLELVARLAGSIKRRKLDVPAAFALEAHQPVRRIAGQAMRLASPAASALGPFLADLLAKENLAPADYDRLAGILERKAGYEALLDAVRRTGEDGAA